MNKHKKFCNILIAVLFCVWIIPLGAFIKPKDEKKACNGRRAICLCTHLVKKQMAKMAGKQFLINGGGVNKEQSSSPSFGPDFFLTIKTYNSHLAKNPYSRSALIPINQLFTRPIEHVPKV